MSAGRDFIYPRRQMRIVKASSSPGGTMKAIRFQIHEANCEARSAVARVLSDAGDVPESFTIYGELEQNEAGQTVHSRFVFVYDKVGAYLNESNKNLFGRIGHALYLKGMPKYPYQPWTCWEVIGIADQQTECEAF